MSKLEHMQGIIATAVAGDVVLVRDTGSGRSTSYKVTCVTGEVAPVVELVGVRGARRALIDGGDVIWIRRWTQGEPAFRRVTGLVRYSSAGSIQTEPTPGGKHDANSPDSVAVTRIDDSPGTTSFQRTSAAPSITPLRLGRLIACSSTEDVVGWVIDRLTCSTDPVADATARALQVYMVSRERMPELTQIGVG